VCGVILLALYCVTDIIYSGETMSVKKEVKMPVQGAVVESHYYLNQCWQGSVLTRICLSVCQRNNSNSCV